MRKRSENQVDDIRNLPASDWREVQVREQSRYSWSPCERCDERIQPGERHERRMWAHGPAEVKQHIVCPTRKPCREHAIVNCPCEGPIAKND